MTPVGDLIAVEFDFANLPMRSLMRRVQSFHRPNRAVQLVVSVVGWLVLTVGLVGLLQVANGYSADGAEFILIGFAAGMVATVVVVLLMAKVVAKSQMEALLSARSRQGRVRIVLGADGLRYQSAGLSSHYGWENIRDVIVVQGTTLLMPSRAEFFPVPHGSLPGDVSPEELLRRIAGWHQSAEVTA